MKFFHRGEHNQCIVQNASFPAHGLSVLTEIVEAILVEPVVALQAVAVHKGSTSRQSPEFHSLDSSGVALTFHIVCFRRIKLVSDLLRSPIHVSSLL